MEGNKAGLLLNRQVRDASSQPKKKPNTKQRRRKQQKKKTKKSTKKTSKKKANKRQQRKRSKKRVTKKSKKDTKSKRKRNKKNGKKMKNKKKQSKNRGKNRKGKNKSKKKNKKSNRKQKLRRKSKKANRKKTRKNKSRRRSNNRQACPVDTNCLALSIKYQTKVKEKVTNFRKQKERIEKYIRVTNNKGSDEKRSTFSRTVQRLRTSGGGNSSALMCQNTTKSPAAKRLNSLVTKMDKCKDNIGTKCITDLPAYNKSVADDCLTVMEAFENLTLSCSTDCSCWTSSELEAAFTKTTACSLVDTNAAITTHKKTCVAAFSECKGLEDEAGQAIAACEAKPKNVKNELNITNGTRSKVEQLVAKVKGLGVGRSAVSRQNGTQEEEQETSMSCEEFASDLAEVDVFLQDDPSAEETIAAVDELLNVDVEGCTQDILDGMDGDLAIIIDEVLPDLIEYIDVLMETYKGKT